MGSEGTRKDLRTRWHATAVLVVVGAALLALFGAYGAKPAAATHVAPVPIDGNPTCADLGTGWTELKIQPVDSGTYTDGTLSVTIVVDEDAQTFDWTSNIGVDAVFVKAGSSGNFYRYDPPAEATADTGLHGQVNPANNKFFGLSHLSFCYDVGPPPPSLTVSKTAQATFTRTFEWDIDKSVDPDQWDLDAGESGTSDYTVEVTKTGHVDSNWAVSGVITVFNSGSVAANVTGVSDEVSGVGAVAVNCEVTFPHTLAVGASFTCGYSSPLPNGNNRTNTATATTSDGSSFQGSASITFGTPTTLVNDEVTIEDTFAGELGKVNDDETFEYERTFVCNRDAGVHSNTATIVETGQSADADVTVVCNELPPPPPPPPPPPAVIDLSITKTDLRDPVVVGESIDYSIVVTNNGPNNATGVTVTDTLPTNLVAYVSGTFTAPGGNGTCSFATPIVTCQLGALGVGQTATITLVVTAQVAGTALNEALVVGNESEPNTANNRDNETTLIQGPFTPPSVCANLRLSRLTMTVGKKTRVVVTARNQRGRRMSGVTINVRGPGVRLSKRTNRRGNAVFVVSPRSPGIVTFSVPGRRICSRRVGVLGVFQPPLSG